MDDNPKALKFPYGVIQKGGPKVPSKEHGAGAAWRQHPLLSSKEKVLPFL